MHGQFVWYELTTPDPDASIKFYPKFTSWGTQAFDKDYTMFTHGGVPVAGIFRQTAEMKAQGVPPNWMPYIEASDVDATAAKAKSLGATVVAGPDDIPDTGRFAVIQDPQGAVFGIYKSIRESNGFDGTNVIGRFSWHELMTNDHAKAAEFYGSLFGWKKISEMDMGEGAGMYYLFGEKDRMYGGMFTTPKEMAGMHPFWLVYIHVKDVAKAVEIATKNGASIQRPQMDIPGGSIAILGDPQGAGYAVHHAPPVEEKPVAKAVATVKSAVRKAAATVKAVATKATKAAKKKVAARAKVAKKKVSAKPKAAKKKVAVKPRAARKVAPKKAKSASNRKASKAKSAPRRKAKAKK